MYGNLWTLPKLTAVALRSRKLSLSLAISLLFVGVIVYLAHYPSSVYINLAAQRVLSNFLAIPLPLPACGAFIFSVPAGLWACSFILVLRSIPSSTLGLALAMFSIFGYELGQHHNINMTRGTFDPWDLFASGLGVVCALAVTSRKASIHSSPANKVEQTQ